MARRNLTFPLYGMRREATRGLRAPAFLGAFCFILVLALIPFRNLRSLSPRQHQSKAPCLTWFVLYFLIFLAALAAGALACGVARVVGLRLGLMDKPGGRKAHAKPIALTGGWGIFAAFMLCAGGGGVAGAGGGVAAGGFAA